MNTDIGDGLRDRILGGTTAKAGEFPWQVKLVISGRDGKINKKPISPLLLTIKLLFLVLHQADYTGERRNFFCAFVSIKIRYVPKAVAAPL